MSKTEGKTVWNGEMAHTKGVYIIQPDPVLPFELAYKPNRHERRAAEAQRRRRGRA